MLTCRPFTAAEGKAAGFINEIVEPDHLVERTEQLASQLAAKAPLTVYATKRHVNAVTDQMVGTMRSWSDADGLVVALSDPDCREARKAYLADRRS